MNFIDTHTHLYLSDFQEDLSETIRRAFSCGVDKFLLPNLDNSTLGTVLDLCGQFPGNCYPMIGLHPTYVNDDYLNILDDLYKNINISKFIAIGEIGIDLYRDTTFITQQKEAFSRQLDWAYELSVPVVIHCREAFKQIIEVLSEKIKRKPLTGVFHSFAGTVDDAKTVIDLGFLIGINGIVTFKNSNIGEVIKQIPLGKILLETDAPYLAPVPYRGRRNESSYIPLIAKKVAELYDIEIEEVAKITTFSANNLFSLKQNG